MIFKLYIFFYNVYSNNNSIENFSNKILCLMVCYLCLFIYSFILQPNKQTNNPFWFCLRLVYLCFPLNDDDDNLYVDDNSVGGGDD